jgi:pimeloyl-ACP methyl ester carboxylesterase
MIHGAFCGPWAFDRFREPFVAAGYAVHAPALRLHGSVRDRAGLATTSLFDYAADLERFVSRFDQRPVLVGHSLGGLLAQMLAARGLVRALVLLAPSPPWGILPTTLFELASAQALLLTGDYWNRPLRPDYDVAASHSLDRLSPPERREVFARFVPESGLATFEIMHALWDVKRAAQVTARDVTCPIFCLVGERDRINPPSTVRRIAERYRGRAIFETLPGHSHWLIGEPGWEKIAARACDWISEVCAAPAAEASS